MGNTPRVPLTPAERLEIRDRISSGEIIGDVARAFNCSPRTVEKYCVGLRLRRGEGGRSITNKQIERIAELRKEKVNITEISRLLGVSITSVTRYSPRELKNAGSMKGGQIVSARKSERAHKDIIDIYEVALPEPPPRPKPKVEDELPDAVLRMTESFRMRGMAFATARAEAIRIYAKTKR